MGDMGSMGIMRATASNVPIIPILLISPIHGLDRESRKTEINSLMGVLFSTSPCVNPAFAVKI
jgi:hypothetical protein